MKNNVSSISPLVLEAPVKAVSSLFDAFTSLFNLMMIGILGLFIAVNVVSFFTIGVNILRLGLTAVAGYFLFRYIQAILKRSLEVSNEGIDYREASRKVVLTWDEIEGIKVEKYLGQITFWVNNQKVRIHTYGLNRRQQAEVHKALDAQVKAHGITVR